MGSDIVWSSQNILFKEDLSTFLTSVGASIYQDRTLEVTNELKTIPFEFVIPKDALESYNGKYAWITYGINIKGERKWRPDVNKKILFQVINSNKKTIPTIRSIKEDRNENGTSVRIELERNAFSPGETLRGALTVEHLGDKGIRAAKLTLVGSEYAVALSEEKIGLIRRKKQEREMTTATDKYSIDIDLQEGVSVPFEIYLPTGLKKSYVGSFSKYFWILDTKLDISKGRDFHVKTEIEII